MFTKVNVRQEQFLWLVVDGMPATRAYAEVYGLDKSEGTCASNASKLLKNAKVLARRQEIVAAKAARQPMSAEFLTREALATAAEARSIGQHSAAIAGYHLAAKLHGLIVDRAQLDTIVRKPSASPESPDDMSEEQWLGQFGVTIDHNPETHADKMLTNVKTIEPEGSDG